MPSAAASAIDTATATEKASRRCPAPTAASGCLRISLMSAASAISKKMKPSDWYAAKPLRLHPVQHIQLRLLRAIRVEILGSQPALERGFSGRPFVGQHREPGGVAAAALDDHVIAKNAFKGEAEAQRGAARGGVERVAFPLVAAIAQRFEDVAGQKILRFGRERRALQRRAQQN